jgi:hypothetical protein
MINYTSKYLELLDTPIKLIGVSGAIGSGKDTVANIITNLLSLNKGNTYGLGSSPIKISNENIYRLRFDDGEYSGWKVVKFADKLKEIVCLLTGCDRQDLEDQEFKQTNTIYNKTKDEFYTYRELMQKIGTECMRYLVDDEIWLKALFANYNPNSGINWIVSDVRFPNELLAIEERKGVLIKLMRNSDSDKQLTKHISETALDEYENKFHFIIHNNGTLYNLIEDVKNILKLLNIIK